MAAPTLQARRRLARLLLLVLALDLPVSLGLRAGVAGAAPRPAGTCATAEPATARAWQAAFDGLNDPTWSGGNQGASLRLPDGRVLWMFADSFRGAQRADGSRAAGSTFVHNSLVLSDRGCLRGSSAAAGARSSPPRPTGSASGHSTPSSTADGCSCP